MVRPVNGVDLRQLLWYYIYLEANKPYKDIKAIKNSIEGRNEEWKNP